MSRAAIRYAKAILDIALTSGRAEAVKNDMMTMANAITESHELRSFLASPVMKLDIKKSALEEIFKSIQPETSGLIRLLYENKRFEILDQIAQQYVVLYDEKNGLEKATVTTAFPITPELEAKVMEKIKLFSDKKVTIQNIVDPAIIGGFILRLGDKQYNASVASKLSELKREFSN